MIFTVQNWRRIADPREFDRIFTRGE